MNQSTFFSADDLWPRLEGEFSEWTDVAPQPPSGTLPFAAWASQMGRPAPESTRLRRLAHVGGISAVFALAAYLLWRITYTLPASGWNRSVALVLVTFEALPLAGLVVKAITLWSIDSAAPSPVTEVPAGTRVVVLIPTYNEPAAVIAPTIAAACALQPAHETWVLDDGSRPWVADMCTAYGARYVARMLHDHAKAGNMNHALDLMEAEEFEGGDGVDVIAVLDCDHVPLPTFLTATLGWFDDDDVAVVQGPQTYYNAGAFDDDGYTGEQGLFFNVLMPSRHHSGSGPFWCGSTSLLRVSALREVGGIATETLTEDMHTSLKLIRAGWRTVYHHQTLAVGLAPSTPDQYLMQRRRWGMGAMQILVQEGLWTAKRWMTWRTWYEYVSATLWWLEGVLTLVAFVVPITVLASGAETSTAGPFAFGIAFSAMLTTRLWGTKRLLRNQIHWPTAFALRIFRLPVGVSCVSWLWSRRTLQFEVVPKGGADERVLGRAPRILWALATVVAIVLTYALAGVAGVVPWHTSTGSTMASGVWLAIAGFVLYCGARRIRSSAYATSRRNAYRVAVHTPVSIDFVDGELIDISVGGAAVRFPAGTMPPAGRVELRLPGTHAVQMEMVRMRQTSVHGELASLQVVDGDWAALRTMALWLFHTPAGAVAGLPAGVPVIATLSPTVVAD